LIILFAILGSFIDKVRAELEADKPDPTTPLQLKHALEADQDGLTHEPIGPHKLISRGFSEHL